MGATIQTGSQAKARVIGISFEGNEPVFLIGDNQRQEKVTMKNIVRIDSAGSAGNDNGGGGNSGGAAPSGGGIQTISAAQGAPNFFTFQKGVGSANIDRSGAPPEVQAAIKKFEEQSAAQNHPDQSVPSPAAPAPGPASAPRQHAVLAPQQGEEKGFPNGLHDEPVNPKQ